MPIFIGTSTKNQKVISLGTQQMQRVYVGDKLVWQKSLIYPVKYGLLYNWYVVIDSRNIAASGWHVPEVMVEWYVLINYLGSDIGAGGKLKENNLAYWNSPNTGAINLVGFNLRGNGYRNGATGGFTLLKSFSDIVFTNTQAYHCVAYSGSANTGYNNSKTQGGGVRLLKDSTTLTHGQTGTYVGNDSKIYKTICIGTQEWLADNLAETKYRDGSLIPFAGANGVNYTDAEWAALITPGCCAYNNDLTNV